MKTPAEMQSEWAKAIADAGAMTEEQMKDAKVPTPRTVEQLTDYISGLAHRPHNYGTCVYAMSMAAVAAFNYVAGTLGATGFQASCADLDILRRTRNFEWGKVLNYENLLYPQYLNHEHFPDWAALLVEHREELAKRAAKLLEENPSAAPSVLEHWKLLAG